MDIQSGLIFKIINVLLKAKDWIVNMFWLFKNVKKVRENAEKGKPSDNARLCPNCDTRMKIGSIYGDGNWFKCPNCAATQFYKTRH